MSRQLEAIKSHDHHCRHILDMYYSSLETSLIATYHSKKDEPKLSSILSRLELYLSTTLLGGQAASAAMIYLGTFIFFSDREMFYYTLAVSLILFVFADLIPKLLFKKIGAIALHHKSTA
jgi:magnesium-transporting ATPase (P-type)